MSNAKLFLGLTFYLDNRFRQPYKVRLLRFIDSRVAMLNDC